MTQIPCTPSWRNTAALILCVLGVLWLTMPPLVSARPAAETVSSLLDSPSLGYAWIAYPQLTADGPGDTLLFAQDATVEARDQHSGALRWRYTVSTEQKFVRIMAVAASAEAVVLLASLTNADNSSVGPFTRTLICLEPTTGAVQWQQSLSGDIPSLQFEEPPPLWVEGAQLYYTDDYAKTVTAYNLTDGAQQWQQSGCDKIAGVVSGALLADCGEQWTLLHPDTGEPWSTLAPPIPRQGWSKLYVALVDGQPWVFVVQRHERRFEERIRNDVEVTAYDLRAGQRRWWFRLTGQFGGLIIQNERLAFRVGRLVLQVAAPTGTPLWRTTLPEASGTGLALADDLLFTSSDVNLLHALEWESGMHRWEADLAQAAHLDWRQLTLFAATADRLLLRAEFYNPTDRLHLNALFALGADAPLAWSPPTPTLQPTLTPTANPPSPAALAESIQPVSAAEATTGAGEFPGLFATYRADLDGDGHDEWIASTHTLRPWQGPEPGVAAEVFACTHKTILCQNAFVIFDQTAQSPAAPYRPVYLVQFGDLSANVYHHNAVVTVEDLTGDGQPEIVLVYRTCGATNCWDYVQVGQWDGQRWSDLTSPDLFSENLVALDLAQITIADRDGDGHQEIVLYGGGGGSVGAGIQRRRTAIYRYEDGGYRLSAEIRDTPPVAPYEAFGPAYFALIDAHTAWQAGQLDQTLAHSDHVLATVALDAPVAPDQPVLTPEARVHIAAYAAILKLLVYAERGEREEMAALVTWIAANTNRFGNPYVAIAQRLWAVYEKTGDPTQACRALTRAIREQVQEAEFLSWYGYAMERIDLRRVRCGG